MYTIPTVLACRYDAVLDRRSIAKNQRIHYKKWLRFHLDFCHKYRFDPSSRSSLPHFDNKLQEKRQADWMRQQTRQAVSLYYDMIDDRGHGATCMAGSTAVEQPARKQEPITKSAVPVQRSDNPRHTTSSTRTIATDKTYLKSPQPQPISGTVGTEFGTVVEATVKAAPPPFPSPAAPQARPVAKQHRPSSTPYSSEKHEKPVQFRPQPSERPDTGHTALKRTGASWIWLYEKLSTAIKVRHYSPRTLEAYRSWIRKLLLQANYDIRTIQELLGHSDVKTTMIYTHTVQSVTLKQAKSPLDC